MTVAITPFTRFEGVLSVIEILRQLSHDVPWYQHNNRMMPTNAHLHLGRDLEHHATAAVTCAIATVEGGPVELALCVTN